MSSRASVADARRAFVEELEGRINFDPLQVDHLLELYRDARTQHQRAGEAYRDRLKKMIQDTLDPELDKAIAKELGIK